MHGSQIINQRSFRRRLVLGIFLAFWALNPKLAIAQEIGVYNLSGTGATATSPAITQVALSAGRYRFTLVTPDVDARATYSAWNPYGGNAPAWSTAYVIGFTQFDGGATTAVGAGQFTFSASPYLAWLATQSKAVEVVIPFDQAVQLYVADSYYADNAGGVSILVELVNAQHVEFRQVSDPASIVLQTNYPILGATTSTVMAPDPVADYRFVYWTINGVRMVTPSGVASNPATFVITGATEAVAHYLPANFDSDGDGLPDWWELHYFGNLAQDANDDPDGDDFTNAMEYANGTDPTVSDKVIHTYVQGGISRRRGQRFNVDVGVGDPTWPYGGVSRRRSASTLVVLNTAAIAVLEESSAPSGAVAQTRVMARGTTVNLTIPPDPYVGYRFTGWIVNGVRYETPTQLQPIAVTVTADTTAVARYIRDGDESDGDGIADWQEWFLFNSLVNDQNSDPDGDGLSYAVEQLRGYSQVASDSLAMGGVSRRRSTTVTVDTTGRLPFRIASDPASILDQTQYFPAGTVVTAPDKRGETVGGYLFAWWDLNGVRQADSSGIALSAFSFTLTSASTATAHYIAQGADSDGDGIPDWDEMYYYGTLQYGPNDDTDGDGFTYATEQFRGYLPIAADLLSQGGLSRRRSALTAVNAIFLPNPPAVGVNAATDITQTSARLGAVVNPIGSATTVYFQWGTTAQYGQQTAVQNLAAGLLAVTVNADLSALTPNSDYHFRVVATNAQGTSVGEDAMFRTLPPDFATWAAIYGVGGPEADDDRDGIPNLFEFALGFNPSFTNDSARFADYAIIELINGRYVLRCSQPFGVTGITYGAQYSLDLTNWIDLPDQGTSPAHFFITPIELVGTSRIYVRWKIVLP